MPATKNNAILRRSSFLPPSASNQNVDLDKDLFSSKDSGKAKNFKVVVRVRPISDKEKGRREEKCLTVDNGKAVVVSTPNLPGAGQQAFAYDRVYDEHVDQATLYNSAMKSVVLSALDGYNGSIIAYGQTGTGKTYTIEGLSGEARGIIPRASEEVFAYIDRCSKANSKFLVRVSFLQIYNEKIVDLLDRDKLLKRGPNGLEFNHLGIREDPQGGVFVENLSEHIVRNSSQIIALLETGAQIRATAATEMNRTSSRSHAVFTIIIEHAEHHGDGESVVTIGKLNLVDLAGSERVKSTGITLADGKRMDEAKNINSSLSAFSKVILSLTTAGSHHVPYRDSKLTRILQGSLGGNCKTTLVTTIGPAKASVVETVNSLKFASRAKLVKNYAVINQDLSDQALLSAYEKEIKRLQEELQRSKSGVGGRKPLEENADPMVIEELKRQHTNLAIEKKETQDKLQVTLKKVQDVNREKTLLQKRVESLQAQLVSGGNQSIEESPEFQEALERAESKMKADYEEKLAQLTLERKQFEAMKAAFESEREEFESWKSRRSSTQRIRTNNNPLDGEEKPFAAYTNKPLRGWTSSGSGMLGRASTSSPKSSLSTVSQYESEGSHMDDSLESLDGGEEDAQLNNFDEDGEDGDTVTLEVYMKALRHPVTGIQTHDARYNHQYHRRVFSGRIAAKWFMDNMEGVYDIETARLVGQKFLDLNVFVPLDKKSKTFSIAEQEMYSFSAFDSSNQSRPDTAVRVRTPNPKPFYRNNSGAKSFRSQLAAKERQSQRQDNVSNQYPRSPQRRSTIARTHSTSRIPEEQEAMRLRSNSRAEPTSNSAPGGPRTGLIERVSELVQASFENGVQNPLTKTQLQREWIQEMGEYEQVGASLLHNAAARGDRLAIKTLCQTFQIDCVDNLGRTPLMYACLNNKAKAVDFLIKHGADPNVRDTDGRVTVFYAAYHGHHDVLKVLLKSHPDLVSQKDPDGRVVLHWCTRHKSPKCVEQVLRVAGHGVVDMQDNEGTTALHWALLCKNEDNVVRLLRGNAHIEACDNEGRTAIHYAVTFGALRCLKLLMEHSSAAECVNLVDKRGRTALHLAVNSDTANEIVPCLMSFTGVNINALDSNARTPLHWAAVCDTRGYLCRLLLAKGADPDYRDNSGRTPMHYATEKNNEGAIQEILRAQSRTNKS
eukprot:m.122748 g.122748  ORF g.122748 m.122748 type:complete len:1176 (+) comp14429_c0_seq3:204-3731(+)